MTSPQRPAVLEAFTVQERERAHTFLATKVATMMGRKFEENDWSEVYCAAKGIPCTGWSNLSIDIVHKGLGVEQKMLRVKSQPHITDHCGQSFMHPAATRSIRIPTETDATAAARDVLQQYADLIAARTKKVKELSGTTTADMRTGWLLWQDELREFLYFEEQMLPPDPNAYFAEWRQSGGGSRKASKNLWVFENDTKRKRYSITTEAGAKIQPYFDVPPATDAGVYVFVVQGQEIQDGKVRLWVTQATAKFLEHVLGSIDATVVADAIMKAQATPTTASGKPPIEEHQAVPIVIPTKAYERLRATFPGVSDEHSFQLFTASLV